MAVRTDRSGPSLAGSIQSGTGLPDSRRVVSCLAAALTSWGFSLPPTMEPSTPGNVADAPLFRFSKAPKPPSSTFLDPNDLHAPNSDVSGTMPNASIFRRSSQHHASNYAQSTPLNLQKHPTSFPLTPHTPSTQQSPGANFFSNQPLAESADAARTLDISDIMHFEEDETKAVAYDDSVMEMESPLAAMPGPAPRSETGRKPSSLIQERIARIKQQNPRPAPSQPMPSRPFAKITKHAQPSSSQDPFNSRPFPAVPPPSQTSRGRDAQNATYRASLPTRRREESIPRTSPEGPDVPYIRSKSVAGTRSASTESFGTRGLPAVLAEALVSAETWNTENQEMVIQTRNHAAALVLIHIPLLEIVNQGARGAYSQNRGRKGRTCE